MSRTPATWLAVALLSLSLAAVALAQPPGGVLEAFRAALLDRSDAPHFLQALPDDAEDELRRLDLSSAPAPNARLTCQLADAARPVVPLDLVGMSSFTRSEWDDRRVPDRLLTTLCRELVANATAGCEGLPADSRFREDRCQERPGGPSVAARWADVERAKVVCEDYLALREQCRRRRPATTDDARRAARALKLKVELFYSPAFDEGWLDSYDPELSAEAAVQLVLDLAPRPRRPERADDADE